MGSDGEKNPKSEKPSSPAPQDQTNIHIYPDWAASFQAAYYGPRMPMPAYYNSPVPPSHAPAPYVWGPAQPMMGPYGAPYAAIYPGGVYAHPGFFMGSHPQGHGVPESPVDATPFEIEVRAKGSGNSEQGLIKKLKEIDGLVMSMGSGTAEQVDGAVGHRQSPSADNDGSTDGSDGNTTATDQTRRKRSREGTPTTGDDGKSESKSVLSGEAESSGNKLNATSLPVKSRVPIVSHGTATDFEHMNPPARSPTVSIGAPHETWFQNERELKKEKRKQSNRESARRSRLRKQAETEELARRVESLTAENGTLKSEVDQLNEKSEKMRLENATLVERLKTLQSGETVEFLSKSEDNRAQRFSTENLLSRVNNFSSDDRNIEDNEMYETKTKSGAKLHQLLDASPRADVVAAG